MEDSPPPTDLDALVNNNLVIHRTNSGYLDTSYNSEDSFSSPPQLTALNPHELVAVTSSDTKCIYVIVYIYQLHYTNCFFFKYVIYFIIDAHDMNFGEEPELPPFQPDVCEPILKLESFPDSHISARKNEESSFSTFEMVKVDELVV